MDHGTLGLLLAFVFVILLAVVIIVVVWQRFANQRARAALTRDEAYKQLAEQMAESQQQTVEELSDMRARIERIEQVLKEVE